MFLMAKQSAQLNKVAIQKLMPLPQLKEGLTKRQILKLAKNSVDAVLENGNVAQVAEVIALMDEFVKAVRKDESFIHYMRDELVKYNGNLNTKSGAKIELCEAGVSYDYSEDGTWRSITEQINNLTEQRKKVEEKLRSIGAGKMAVNHQTGEVMIGALKSSRSTYRITLAK